MISGSYSSSTRPLFKRLSPPRKWPVLAMAGMLIGSTSLAQDLQVIVEATHDVPPSRDAHFNWSFESSGGGEVIMGQFACGSWWVAPAHGDTGVRLLALTGNPAWNDLLSCDADPITERHGLLDGSNRYGSHDPGENVIPDLPVTFTPEAGSCISLVAAMQRNEVETGGGGTASIKGEVVDAYCVVTVLDSVPANGGSDMIRPNITGETKELLTWDDFDLTRLPEYAFIEGNSAEEWSRMAVRWSHSTEVFGGVEAEIEPGEWDGWKVYSEGGRAFRSHILINNYAAGMTAAFNNDLLALFSSENTLDEKKAALAAILSFGLDIYHARYDYGTGLRKRWPSGAGQHGGKFLPCVFAASLLKDQAKAHELRKVAVRSHIPDRALLAPQELRQLHRGVTGVLLWGDGHPIVRKGNTTTTVLEDRRYWADFKASNCYDTALDPCNSSVGKKTAADPYGYHDGPANKPGVSYMIVSFGSFRGIAAAMILMPEIRSIVNTDAPIEYVDRVLRHGIWAAPDPVAPISVVDQQNECDPFRGGINCSEWGVTWGPRADDVRFAVEDGTGRFVSRHGLPMETSYESPRAQDNWSSIIALYDGETYETNAVDLDVVVAPEVYLETGENPQAHLWCATLDSEIRYTLDGSDPDASSTLYTDPIPVIDGMEIRSQGFYQDYAPSSVRSIVINLSGPGQPGFSWGGISATGDGAVQSGTRLGTLHFLDNYWAWSSSWQAWLNAPDPGPDFPGCWIYRPL